MDMQNIITVLHNIHESIKIVHFDPLCFWIMEPILKHTSCFEMPDTSVDFHDRHPLTLACLLL